MKSYTIPKHRQLPPALDYEFLRSEGLKYVEQLASDVWTDYNAHDPGVTILEALCYAITELGYRSSFEMRDLLHDATGQVMYPARQILTNHPFTIADYRKLLVDIDGVNNAWLYTAGKQETMFFYSHDHRKLQVDATDIPVYLNGLYNVVLDLVSDEQYGDLNSGDVELASLDGKVIMKFEFPSYGDIDLNVLKVTIASTSAVMADGTNHYKLVLKDTDDTVFSFPFTVTVTKQPATGKVDHAAVWEMLQDEGYAQQIADTYLQKLTVVDGIIKEVSKQLNAHRNLCEDFVSVKQVSYEEVALCVDIDASPGADIEQIQAALFYAIDNYLNPSVNFYSLKELLDKGWEIQDIYNGVALNNGFIDPQQLEETQLRTHVYASDIISLLMDIDGVISVRNLLMTKYDHDGKPVDGFIGLDWCMRISDLHKPILSASRSKIILYKEGFPFHANAGEVSDILLVMRAQRTLDKRKGFHSDLTVGGSKQRDTLSYRPVQYDLPNVYGVGEAGLPPHAETMRKAQQRQLKGYLMFFEQLLADFFAQLTNAHRLFSIEDIKQTYFAQYLGKIKDTEGLLANTLENAITLAPDHIAWQDLYENNNQYTERRNRFLDHLLARFAESFNDFALLQYRINFEEQTEERISSEELIATKVQTLANYPEISANRSHAFNYFPQTDGFELAADRLWDTDNVSGLEKRIGALTGIQDVTRRFLYCINHTEIHCDEEDIDGTLHCRYYFKLTARVGMVLASPKLQTRPEAEAMLKKVLDATAVAENFKIKGKKIAVFAGEEQLLVTESDFATPEEANAAVETLLAEFAADCGNPEGLHLIEHLLLRPRTADFKLMDLCETGDDCICELDSYSFRASVVLPYWPDHFDNLSFRKYMEEKLQEEAPAHIQLKVCWISNEQMRQFEVCYKSWTTALAAYFEGNKQDVLDLQQANDRLLELLPQLRNIYPQATLHNCAESNIENNPVMLGKTILGTFLNR